MEKRILVASPDLFLSLGMKGSSFLVCAQLSRIFYFECFLIKQVWVSLARETTNQLEVALP